MSVTFVFDEFNLSSHDDFDIVSTPLLRQTSRLIHENSHHHVQVLHG